MIRNDPGLSSYFQGGYRNYGRYQWIIKYGDFRSEEEIESAIRWAFGEYMKLKSGGYGFDTLNQIMGREIVASIQGRQGGWFVIDTELSPAELKKIDKFIARTMKALPQYLKEERAYQAGAVQEAQDNEVKTTNELSIDPRVTEIKRLVNEVAGCDAVLTLKGIRII